MRADDLRQILLVRAIEERDYGAISAPLLREAQSHVGRPGADEGDWFLRRSRFILDHLPPSYASLASTTRFPKPVRLIVFLAAIVLGVATNVLGTTGQINVVFNPVMALLVWNLFVYLLIFLGAFWGRQLAQQGTAATHRAASKGRTLIGIAHWPSPSSADRPGGLLVSYVVLPVWGRFRQWLRRWLAEYREAGREVERRSDVTKQYLIYWGQSTFPLSFYSAEQVIHGVSACFAIGAIAGMYFRGLVLEYNVHWSSTFIRDPQTVRAILRVLFAPVNAIFQSEFPDATAVTNLMNGPGSPAADWIHAFAILALLVILVPRAALFVWTGAKARLFARNIPFNFDDAYWRTLLTGPEAYAVSEITRKVLGRLALHDESLAVLIGLQGSLIEEDLGASRATERLADRLLGSKGSPLVRKRAWYERWRAEVSSVRGDAKTPIPLLRPGSPEYQRDLAELQRPPNRFQANLILLETVVFARHVAYKQIGPKDDRSGRLAIERGIARRHLEKASAELAGESRRAYEIGEAVDIALKGLTNYWWKVGGLAAIGISVGALTGGLAAPAIGALIGEAMGLSGAAAVGAGLAGLGGGALAAGGFGVAGGTAVLVGGGSLIGAGLGSRAIKTVDLSPTRVLLECAKLEAVLRCIVHGALRDDVLHREIVESLEKAIDSLRHSSRMFRASGEATDPQIKEMEQATRLLQTVLRRNKR